jgi:hypothetical protein
LGKLASSRGQSSATIAPQKPTTLPLSKLSHAQHEAESKTTRGDDHVVTSFCNNHNISSSSTTLTTSSQPQASITSDSDYFANCKEFLRKSATYNPISFPTSRSVSNIRDSIVEEKSSFSEVYSDQPGIATSSAPNAVDEVEIVSLLEERIPKYKLRADTITKFSGIIFSCAIPIASKSCDAVLLLTD